jgi:hypothetical protein
MGELPTFYFSILNQFRKKLNFISEILKCRRTHLRTMHVGVLFIKRDGWVYNETDELIISCVLFQQAPAPTLSCTHPVLHLPVLHPPCPAPTLSGLNKAFPHVHGHEGRAVEHDVHDGSPALGVETLGGRDKVPRRVVNHDIRQAELRHALVDRRRDRIWVSDVGRHGQNLIGLNNT